MNSKPRIYSRRVHTLTVELIKGEGKNGSCLHVKRSNLRLRRKLTFILYVPHGYVSFYLLFYSYIVVSVRKHLFKKRTKWIDRNRSDKKFIEGGNNMSLTLDLRISGG